MNANLGLSHTVCASDDLVIEEFGRYLLAGQLPVPCGLTGVTQPPSAVARDAARYTV
ncbi:hypothetical protein [Streptomyces sp. NPDC048361]|uniref:hypothetical protein n=1 Tax=Streptomyces sp. NPDC048361 TaxID=3154720 RepID=UPI003442CE1D